MEPKLDRNLNPVTLPPSPNSSTSSSTSSTNNGSGSLPANPLTPKTNNNSVPRTIETTPYPTTFVQADTSSFKQVVQMLTGSTSSNSTSTKSAPITTRSATGPKKPSFKLYERRGSLKNLKSISPLIPTAPSYFSPRSDALSPSILDFPSLVLSPVTPLSPSLASPADAVRNSTVVEEKAIAEKGFFLHPSPRGAEPPRLLPLFPVTSPRVSSD